MRPSICLLSSLALLGCSSCESTTSTKLVPKYQAATSADYPADQLKARLEGRTLEGTVFVKNTDNPPTYPKQRFDVIDVSSISPNRVILTVRGVYNGGTTTIPIPLQVESQGEIFVLNASIPLLAKYAADLILRERQFSGVWSDSNNSGYFIGEIIEKT